MSLKNEPVKIFDTDAKKGVPNRKTRFSQKKAKKIAMFFVSNGSYRTPESLPSKFSENSGKIKFHTKKRHPVPSFSTFLWKATLSDNLIHVFYPFD